MGIVDILCLIVRSTNSRWWTLWELLYNPMFQSVYSSSIVVRAIGIVDILCLIVRSTNSRWWTLWELLYNPMFQSVYSSSIVVRAIGIVDILCLIVRSTPTLLGARAATWPWRKLTLVKFCVTSKKCEMFFGAKSKYGEGLVNYDPTPTRTSKVHNLILWVGKQISCACFRKNAYAL